MFQSMMLCGRQIIDLYQKHAITVMEYKWEAVKEDAEEGFQIDSGSLIGYHQESVNLKTRLSHY